MAPEACALNPVLCANEAANLWTEVIASEAMPAGTGAGVAAVGVGKTVAGAVDSAEGDAGKLGTNTSLAANTLAANKLVGAAAEEEAAMGVGSQEGITVQTQVSLTSGSTRAVADIAVNGAPNATIQVPAGYLAEDVNGNLLLDANGNPITTFKLNPQGQAVVEIKTGMATLTKNQTSVYPAVQSGFATGTQAGTNAAKADMSGPLPPTPVIIIRKQ